MHTKKKDATAYLRMRKMREKKRLRELGSDWLRPLLEKYYQSYLIPMDVFVSARSFYHDQESLRLTTPEHLFYHAVLNSRFGVECINVWVGNDQTIPLIRPKS